MFFKAIRGCGSFESGTGAQGPVGNGDGSEEIQAHTGLVSPRAGHSGWQGPMQVVLLLRNLVATAEALSPQGPHPGPRSQVCGALAGESSIPAPGLQPRPMDSDS